MRTILFLLALLSACFRPATPSTTAFPPGETYTWLIDGAQCNSEHSAYNGEHYPLGSGSVRCPLQLRHYGWIVNWHVHGVHLTEDAGLVTACLQVMELGTGAAMSEHITVSFEENGVIRSACKSVSTTAGEFHVEQLIPSPWIGYADDMAYSLRVEGLTGDVLTGVRVDVSHWE